MHTFLNRRRIILWSVSALIGAVLGVVMSNTHTTFTIAPFLTLLLLIPALYLQVALHELGHLIAGSLSGFRLISLRIFWLALERKNNRFVWQWKKAKGYGGLCLMVPARGEMSRLQNIFYYSGGILMHLVVLAVCLLFINDLPGSAPIVVYFVYISMILAVFMAIGNLLPFKTKGNSSSDGRHILQAILNNSSYRYQCQLYLMSVKSMEGVRPAAFDIRHWPDMQDIGDDALRVRFLMLGYYHHLDRGDIPAALQSIHLAEQYLGGYPVFLLENIQAELLFAAAALENKHDKAKELYENVRRELEKEKTLTTLRIRAAWNWFVLNDATEAHQLIEQAHALSHSYDFPGFVPFEQGMLALISNSIPKEHARASVA